MTISPMLLEEVEYSEDVFKKFPTDKFIWEEKHNGERALIHIRDGKVAAMRNRSDNPVHQRFPELTDNPEIFKGIDTAIIDCEVVVMKDNKSIFYGGINQRRSEARGKTASIVKDYPVSVIVFDLLYINGENIMAKPYEERLNKLKQVIKESEQVKIVENVDNPKEYWDTKIITENREGFVIKDKKAPYLSGMRVKTQLKLKNYKRAMVKVEAIEQNPKGAKLTGKTQSGLECSVQWSSCGWENIKVGDEVEIEFLDTVNNQMVQPHKVKSSTISAVVD